MATQPDTTLKGYFEAGDTPTEAQFADLIDSKLSLVDGGTVSSSMTVDVSSTSALLVEDDGTNDTVLIVDTVLAQVGINTVPANTLHVVGGVTFDHNSVSTFVVEDTGTTENVLMVDTANGRVGINTAPTVAFDVTGAAAFSSTVAVSGAVTVDVASTTALLVEDTGTTDDVLVVDTSNGRVGIGTTPDKPLHVKADTYGMFVLDRTANANADRQWYVTPSWDGVGPTEHLAFGYGPVDTSNRLMILTEDGRLSVGTTGPESPFHVSINEANYMARFYNNGNNDNRNGMIIRAGADANPSHFVILIQDGDGTNIGSIKGDGSGGTNFNTTSDSRRKEIIEDVPTDSARTALQNLTPFRYRGKVDDDNPGRERPVRVGFPAEVVAQHTEGVAIEDEDGFFSMDYSKMLPYVWRMLQDIDTRLSTVEGQVQ